MKTVANSAKSAYPSYDQADFFDGTAARKIEHGVRIISIDRRSVHTSGAIAQETSRRSERGARACASPKRFNGNVSRRFCIFGTRSRCVRTP